MKRRIRRSRCGSARARSALAATAAIAIIGLQGCAAPPTPASDLPTSKSELVKMATEEGEVAWSAPKPKAQMQGAIDLFEEEYPGIKVKFTNAKAPDQVSQIKVQQAAKKVAIDVAAAGELTVPPSLKMAEGVKWTDYGVDASDASFDDKMIYIWASPKVWAYNTSQLASENAPSSWEEILNTGLPGNKIAVEGRASFMTVWNVNESMGQADALDWAGRFAGLKPHYTTNTTESEQLVESGQAAMGTSLMNLALEGKDSGAPVGIAPVTPTSTNETFIYVPKGAPHPAAAVLFSSFLSSQEAQDQLAEHYNSRIPRNTDCSTPDMNEALQTLCDNDMEWSSTSNIDAYHSLTKFFPEAQKALGTYAG